MACDRKRKMTTSLIKMSRSCGRLGTNEQELITIFRGIDSLGQQYEINPPDISTERMMKTPGDDVYLVRQNVVVLTFT